MRTAYTLLLTIILLTMSATASAETSGWGLAFSVHEGDSGIQGRKDIWLGGDISQITLAGSVYFNNKTTFRLDADYHFILNPADPGRFYPLVGGQFAFNSDHSKFGLNVGGGLNFMLTEHTAAFVELKHVFGDWDGFCVTGGIYF